MQYKIHYKNKTSIPFTSTAGVPQGSAISSILFNMYINDNPQPIRANDTTLQYADDLTILIQHRYKPRLRQLIQKELTNIDNYQAKWLINTNKVKSAITLFHQNANTINGQPLIRVNGEFISYKNTTKMLGVELDTKLNMKKHIDSRVGLVKYTLSRLGRFRILNTKVQSSIDMTKTSKQSHKTSLLRALERI